MHSSHSTLSCALRWLLCALCWLAASFVAGCSTGPAVGTISGDVTFDGKPVKDGRILFTPVDGKSGTGGASIVEGKYEAKDVPAAKMRVEINGNKVIGTRKAYDTPQSPVFPEVAELLPAKPQGKPVQPEKKEGEEKE